MELSFVIPLVEAVEGSAFLSGLVVFFASHWDFFIAAVLLGYVVVYYKKPIGRMRAGLVGWALVASAAARFVLVEAIRFFAPQPRPFVVGEFTPLVEHAATAGFPSGHATFFMVLAVFILLAGERGIGWFLFASAVVVGIARVFAGLHFPADIVAGWALGALVGWVAWLLYKKYVSRKEKILD